MLISIIICTKDRKEDLFETIYSIKHQSRQPDELIIVDASTGHSFKNELLEVFQELNIKYFHTEPGLTKQRNLGIKMSSGDIIVFFDDDVILDPNYLFYIEKVFIEDTNKKIGGVMGRITNINPNSLRFKLANLYSKIFFLTSEGNGKLKMSGLPTHPFTKSYDHPIEVEVLSGAQMAYRCEVFQREIFDEALSGYCYMEDVDFSYRVSRRFKLIYEPRALIKHMVSPRSRLSRREKKKMFVLNHYYLFRKNCCPSPTKWLAFVWAQIGQLIQGVLLLDIYSLLGMLDAWLVIIKQSFDRKGLAEWFC